MKKYSLLKKLIKSFLKKIGFYIINKDDYHNLVLMQKRTPLIVNLTKKKYKKITELKKKTKSELNQEFFALLVANFKYNGFFIEIGAANGKDFSNTYLLEKNFLWNGIVAEPAKIWHKNLLKNRSCYIEKNCLWSHSNKKINFLEATIPTFSSIKMFSKNDNHEELRKNSKEYIVKTISLIDMLKKHNSPKIIDYLSIDTEGSEFEILKKFDFNSYKFNFISCEHNYNSSIRKKINNLLTENGYKIKFSEYSSYDDWYVRK
jgi:FkbM family methyltransferase